MSILGTLGKYCLDFFGSGLYRVVHLGTMMHTSRTSLNISAITHRMKLSNASYCRPSPISTLIWRPTMSKT